MNLSKNQQSIICICHAGPPLTKRRQRPPEPSREPSSKSMGHRARRVLRTHRHNQGRACTRLAAEGGLCAPQGSAGHRLLGLLPARGPARSRCPPRARCKPSMTSPNGSDTKQLMRQALTPIRPQQSRRRRYDQRKDQTRMPDTSLPEPLTMTRSKGRATTSASSASANVEMATARKVHLVLQGKGGVGNPPGLFPIRGAAPTPS